MADEKRFAPSSLAEWKRNSTMDVTLPSGTRVQVRTLTLDELAGMNGLPEDLLRVALLEQASPGGVVAAIGRKLAAEDPESLKDAHDLSKANVELVNRLVVAAVVAPKLKAADVKSLDPFDRDMIAQLAQRRITHDAAGKQVGADALDSFRAGCRILARSETDDARKAMLLELAEVQ